MLRIWHPTSTSTDSGKEKTAGNITGNRQLIPLVAGVWVSRVMSACLFDLIAKSGNSCHWLNLLSVPVTRTGDFWGLEELVVRFNHD